MSSGSHNPHPAAKCSCAVSQQESSAIPAGLFELRYDLPRAYEALQPVLSAYCKADAFAIALDGFHSLPDQPPKSPAE